MIQDPHSRQCVTEFTPKQKNKKQKTKNKKQKTKNKKTSRAIVVSGNLGASPTFVHAREAVLQHSELVDLAELLEEGPEVLLVQVAGDLTDEEFDGIVVLHGDGSRAAHRAVAVA